MVGTERECYKKFNLQKDIKQHIKLLVNIPYHLVPSFAEAEWLSGWIALTF